jgi:COP9 signalosome complex subunit 3
VLQEQQYRFYVSRLSKTFSALPVSSLSSTVGGSVDELTTYLSKLIQNGSLNASIEQSAKVGVVLRFFLDPTQGPLAKTEKQQQQVLLEQTHRTNILAEQVRGADYRLALTKEHVDHLKRQSKKSGTGAGDAMDTTWDDGIDAEEDIMVGL